MVYPNNINLNLNTQYVLPIPTAQQGDTARVLTFNILDNGVPFSLQGKTVRAKIVKPDNTKCYNDLTITNATNGECALKLTNQILAVAGKVNCQLEIKEGEELLSTIIFSIDVEPSIDINGAVESTNEFTALLNGIIKLDEWDKYFKETSGAIEEKYTERLNGIDSSLEEIESQSSTIKNVKSYGAYDNNTNPDTTTQAIKDAITAANDEDMVYIPPGVYAINDTITINKKIHFVCDGTIKYCGTRDKAVFHFIRPIGRRIEFNGEVSDESLYWHGWTNENYIGIIFENAFKCRVRVTVVRNFTIGVRCITSGGQSVGFFFNTFNILQLIDNKIQLEIYQKDTGSWFNSNIFNDVFFTYTQTGSEVQTSNVDRYCIKQTFENNTVTADSNIFYNLRFDISSILGGTYTGISLARAWAWKFIKYRAELVSGSNTKFANLDLSSNQIYELEFDPVFESYKTTDNIKINLLNSIQGTRTYNQIFKKSGVLGNNDFILLYDDKNWNERYRKISSDYNIIDKLYRYRVDGTLLNATYETESEYSSTDKLIENGVSIGTYNMGVLYLKNLAVGDTIKFILKTAVSPGTPQISIKAWDATGSLIDDNEITVSDTVYKAIAADNMYWDAINHRLAQSNAKSTQTITINRSEVKTVAVMFAGGLNGIEIYSSKNEISVLRSVVSSRNNFPHHALASIPTLKTDGNFLAGDIIYNSNITAGQDIAWQLADSTFAGSGTLAWKSLGKY